MLTHRQKDKKMDKQTDGIKPISKGTIMVIYLLVKFEFNKAFSNYSPETKC